MELMLALRYNQFLIFYKNYTFILWSWQVDITKLFDAFYEKYAIPIDIQYVQSFNNYRNRLI